MNKLLIICKTQTDKDFNPELVADLVKGVLKSTGIFLVSIEFTKVAEVVVLKTRTSKSFVKSD